MATIKSYKKQGKTYYRFQAYLGINKATGRRKNVSRSGFKSKREAQIVLDRLRYEFQTKKGQQNDLLTYGEVYEMWEPVYATTVREATLNRVLSIFRNHVLPVFNSHRIADIDARFCQRFINDVGSKVENVRIIGNYAGLVFKYAIKLQLITSNPMESVTYPQVERQPNNNFWNKEELQTFLKVLDTDYANKPKVRTLMRLASVTGMRLGEILALQVRDFSLEDRSISVNKTVTRSLDNSDTLGNPKTTASNRTLYLDDKTTKVLAQWIMQQRRELLVLGFNANNDDQLLFPSTKNTILSSTRPRAWLKKIIADHDLKPITFHGIRHSVATALSQAGLPIKSVQVMLGDSDIQVVLNHYLYQDQQMRQEASEKFARYLGN